MSRPLSIADAASEHPERLGLVLRNRSYTFGELATLTRAASAVPLVVAATAGLETVLRLYKLLEDGGVSAFVSPQCSDGEYARVLARMQAAQVQGNVLVLFTSGSSGQSKGVRLSHDALSASALAANEHLGWRDGDRWLCCLPLSHIGGLSVMLRALAARRAAVLEEGFSADGVAKRLSEERITHVSLVPTMLWRLLVLGTDTPPMLRICLMGGAALSESLRTRAGAAGFPLRTCYGMTETASMVVCDGELLPGTAARIDADGAIVLSGPTLMDGYLSAGADGLVQGSLRTSDRGRLDSDGRLEVLGRLDSVIISGGENIDLEEIERELERHANVKECTAVGVEDAEWGQRLVALIVRVNGELPVQGLVLRGFKKPKNLLFVEALPRLENGKLDRQAARKLAIAELER